jgi:CheY-like chemotaxis protein
MDGWQVLAQLKRNPATASIPVMVVTVTEDRQSAGALGVRDFLLKPVERDEFLRRVRELLGSTRPRVLLVDDEPATRKLVGDLLRGEGAQVREAANGREALALLNEEAPDLVLLDLLMPELDGFAVIEAIRARADLAGLPVLVVTAADLTGEDRERLNGHIQALLSKDRLSAEKLRRHLEALGLVPRQAAGAEQSPEVGQS